MSERPKPYHKPTLTQYEEPILPSSGGNISSEEEFAQEFPVRYDLWHHMSPAYGADPLPTHLQRHLVILNNLDKYIAAHSSGRKILLRQNQIAVFKDIYEDLEQGHNEGFIEAPTGFGKTVLFSQLIEAMNQRTVVVVPSRILVEQTAEKLRKFNPQLDCGVFYSDRKEYGNQVTITTYRSLVQSNGGVRPEDIDVLILDEVHQSLTDFRIDAVGRFEDAIKIGFTATPEYTEDKRVADLLNHRYHQISLREAVEQGSLSPFSAYIAETDVDISQVSLTVSGEYDLEELEKAINIQSRNKSAVDLYQQMVAQDPSLAKAIAYCATIAHAQDVAETFKRAGVPAAAIWSDQDAKERNAIISAYKRGDIKILTNVNVLTEGFDDPEAALCINLKPTRSKVAAKQRGGRVLRLDPKNPNKHAVIVDYLDKNEDKRNAQVTFAQIALGDDEIRMVQIGQSSDEEGSKAAKEPSAGDNYDEQFTFDIEGLHVITSREEVLRIIRESILDDRPEGWLTLEELSRSVPVSAPTVKKYLSQVLELLLQTSIDENGLFKEYVVHNAIRQCISPHVIQLVIEQINLQLPQTFESNNPGFIQVPFDRLYEEFNTANTNIHIAFRSLQSRFPDHFKTSPIRQGLFVDNKGNQLLRDYFVERQTPEGYIRFDKDTVSNLATEFGVSPSTVYNKLKILQNNEPEKVIGGNRITYSLEPSMLPRLRKMLHDPSIESDELGEFHAINVGAALIEAGYPRYRLDRKMQKLKEMYPEHIRTNSRKVIMVTDEGERIIRAAIEALKNS